MTARWDNDVARRTYRKFITLVGTGEEFALKATNVRMERTGLHARVGLFLGERYLGHDEFNISRREERTRLSKHCYEKLGDVSKEALPLAVLGEHLDAFSLELEDSFGHRYTGGRVHGKRRTSEQRFLLRPYLLSGGGTILFAPPGTGKSWVGLLMALSIEYGCTDLWPVTKGNVLFVNLERSEESMQDRLSQAGSAFLRTPDCSLLMLNARGLSMNDVHASVLEMVLANHVSVVVLDSLSRTGLGSMVFDDVSNKSMDLLNSLNAAWLAIGHAPRGDTEHVYGSVMFDAAADLAVKLSAEQRDSTLGLALEVTKANDIAKPATQYIALDFSVNGEDSELVGVRRASSAEFPELMMKEKTGLADSVILYLSGSGKATATELAKETGYKRENVARFLSKSPSIVRIGKQGKEVFYDLSNNV